MLYSSACPRDMLAMHVRCEAVGTCPDMEASLRGERAWSLENIESTMFYSDLTMRHLSQYSHVLGLAPFPVQPCTGCSARKGQWPGHHRDRL